MLSNKIKFWIAFAFVIIGAIFIIINFNKERKNIGTNFRPAEILTPFEKEIIILKNEIIVEVGGKMIKINVDTDEFMDLSEIEKNNFDDFSGLPKQEKNIEQDQIIFSRNKKEMIMSFAEAGESVKTKEYICDISQKKCKPSKILSDTYQGLDAKDKEHKILWSRWDSKNNLLFGYLMKNGEANVPPVYVCNTVEKNCQRTEDFNLKDDIVSTVPQVSFSHSLEKFVVINQYNKAKSEIGYKWELLLFSSKKLSEPLQVYDITTVMDNSKASKGGVHSISWSEDEKKLAIGTEKKIFSLDLERNNLSLAYIAPIDEDGNYIWNSDALFLSLDGRYIVFVDEEMEIDARKGESQMISLLKKIDLENNNSVSEILREYELNLRLQQAF